MATDRVELQDWLQLIRAEYAEFPDLRLTQSEVVELWKLDTSVAGALLNALVCARVLNKTRGGAYVRAERLITATESPMDADNHDDEKQKGHDASRISDRNEFQAGARTAPSSDRCAAKESGISRPD